MLIYFSRSAWSSIQESALNLKQSEVNVLVRVVYRVWTPLCSSRSLVARAASELQNGGRTDVWCLDAPMFVWRFLPDQWLVMHLWAQSATQANIIGQQEQQTEQRRMKTLALRMAFAHCNMWKITVSFNDCTNTEHALSISRCMFPVYLKWLLFMATLDKISYILMPLLLSL